MKAATGIVAIAEVISLLPAKAAVEWDASVEITMEEAVEDRTMVPAMIPRHMKEKTEIPIAKEEARTVKGSGMNATTIRTTITPAIATDHMEEAG